MIWFDLESGFIQYNHNTGKFVGITFKLDISLSFKGKFVRVDLQPIQYLFAFIQYKTKASRNQGKFARVGFWPINFVSILLNLN